MHATICDQLVDLVQNSLEAGATQVVLRVTESAGILEITVKDNGCGMSETAVTRVLDPFYTDGRKHRHRKVGLGLAFLKQMVDATGGDMALTSAPGEGTTVWFRLDGGHVDVPPMGNLSAAVTGMMAFEGKYDLSVERQVGEQGYCVRRSELENALGELETATSLAMAKDYVASQEEALLIRKG